MITLNNTEIIIRLSNDRTKVINYDYLNEFFDYISLQQKTANNNDIKEFKKTYKLNEQKIDRNIITECSKDRYYFDQTKLDYFLSGIDKKYISFVYVATDYGDYGRAGTMYNVNDKNKSLKFEKEDSITNPYNILFTLIKNDDQCKLFCQYTRTGIYSPKAVIENLLQKFKETKSEQEVEIMYEIRNIIPSNIIDNYFGKGTYNKMYVYRNTKDHQDDDLNVTGFNEIEKVASKEIGVVVKGLNIAKKIKLNIVRALKSNDIVKAMGYVGVDMIYYDNATVEIDYNGRKKTFSLCKINKESVSKEISEVKGIENADGNLNKDVVLSEYLLEIHDIIHRRY